MKYVVIIGCGQVGREFANELSRSENVVVIDRDPQALEALGDGFNGKKVWGNALNVMILEEAGMKSADAVYLLTSHDNLNLVIGKVIKRRYNVQRVILQVNDIEKKKIFAEKGLMIINRSYLICDILRKCLS